MGRVIVVTSVPHSGTRFVIEHLLSPLRRSSEPDSEGYLFNHVELEYVPELRRWMREFPCIVPLRHPYSVAESWKKRTQKNSEYYRVASMGDYWRRLYTAIDPLQPLYLPIDRPDRQVYLDRINEVTGMSLTTDWPVVGSAEQPARLFSEQEKDMLETLMDELQPLFSRFGYGRQ